jgi:hypothetical protein
MQNQIPNDSTMLPNDEPVPLLESRSIIAPLETSPLMDFAPSIAESEDFELNANRTIPQESVRINNNIQFIKSQDEKVGQDIEMGDVFQGISQALAFKLYGF